MLGGVIGWREGALFWSNGPWGPGAAMVPWSSAEINHVMADRGVMSRDSQPSLQATHRERIHYLLLLGLVGNIF